MGSIQFEMFGPEKTEFLNYVRTIAVSFDGGRWVFEANGAIQEFEDLNAYQAPRTRDRFTSDLLERYCKALDIDVFNPKAYGPGAVLVRSHQPLPPEGRVLTLAEAQRWLEIP